MKHAQEIKTREKEAAKGAYLLSSKTKSNVEAFAQSSVGTLGLGGTGSISGYVRDMDGNPLSNVWIGLNQGEDPNWADDDAWDWVDGTSTDENGFYRFTGLEERRYHLHYWQEQEIGGKHYLEANQYQVQVSEGAETPNMNFTLRQAAHIWGYLKDSNGNPIIGAHVYSEVAYTEDDDDHQCTREIDSDGKYKLWLYPSPGGKFYPIGVEEAIKPGTTYKVYGGNNYICNDDGLNPENHGYTFLGSATTTQTFSGAYSYYIIRAESSYQIKVDAVQGSNGSYLWQQCDWDSDNWDGINGNPPDGNYALVNRHPGPDNRNGGYFMVNPGPGNSSIKVYIINDGRPAEPIYYETKHAPTLYQATYEGVHGPDFTLNELSGKIHGRVVNENGDPIEGVEVDPQIWINGMEHGDPDTWTDANGYYTLVGLPATNQAYACIDDDEVLHNNVKYGTSWICEGPMTVTSGGTTEAPTITILKAGMIKGMVTDENGVPVVGAEVEASGYDINGNESWSDEKYTDAFGQYTLDYMSPGTYRVRAKKDGFADALKLDVVIPASALSDPQVQVDCDLVLISSVQAATVTGSITNYDDVAPKDPDGVPLPNPNESDYDDFGYMRVELLAFQGNVDWTDEEYLNLEPIGFTEPDDGYEDYFEPSTSEIPGNYSFVLPAGVVDLSVYTYAGRTDGWYVVFHDWHSLMLTEGANLAGQNFTVLTNFGTLKGNISVPSGELKSQRTIIIAFNENDSSPSLFDAFARPDLGTTYNFVKLPAGTYTIRAITEGFETKVYEHVVVTEGATTVQDINFTIGGTLSGTVTDTNGAVEGAKVKVVETGASTFTDINGDYNISGLSAGSYTVEVSASGYATDTQTVSITDGATTDHDIVLNPQVGSISGSVTDSDGGANINNATVVAYNAVTNSHKTATTVGGAYSITDLIYGDYVVAVNADGYAVKTYPDVVTINGANPDPSGVDFSLTGIAPEFSVSSSISGNTLSLTFFADIPLDGDPSITRENGSGTLGTVNPISSTQWQVDYTKDPTDTIVQIKIEGTGSGMTGSETFSFEVTSNLQETATTNVTNAAGGETTMMGTQDNTQVYVPPFALAGTADDTTAVALTIERYGDPGDPVGGTDDTSATAVYDFSFEDGNVDIAENHTITVTMSFVLPAGMTQQEFENTFEVRYFNVNTQQWQTDGISNVRINWNNYTIMFEVSHLSKFAAFVSSQISISLSSSWNLISFSMEPADTAIATVLDSISGKYISSWAFMNGGWKVYDPQNPGFSDLTTMEAGWGYWLNMTEAATLTISGSAPSNSVSLGSGWNLVGCNTSTSPTVS